MRVKDVRKVVLAYSGGLDTSVILKWLQTTYRCEVVTFTADLGQGEELGPARDKARLLGIREENIFVDDLREEFVRDFVFPMFRANALYEGQYLLGTSIARPLIAKRQIEIAEATGADAVAHGATGKGNDQVRFELAYYALKPEVKVIAPWREWDLGSRTALIAFAEQHQIPIAKDKRGEAPFSVDANLLHSSSEGKILEEPWDAPDEMVWQRTIRPEDAPDRATEITVEFERGDAVGINGERLSPATLLTRLNTLGHDNGIGRLDLVENRFVGHEEPRLLRDAGRHHPARRAPGDGEHHARPRGGAPEGRADAALRGAGLQRLLVRAGAADAPGAGGREPAERDRRGAAQALQGQHDRHRPPLAALALLDEARDLRGGRGRLRPDRTPRASSS